MSKARDSDAATRWRAVVRGQAESGLSVAAYCRRASVSLSSFDAWQRNLRDAPSFAEVRSTSAAPVDAAALEVRLPGGRSIVVRPAFDRRTLLNLVATFEPASPRGLVDLGGVAPAPRDGASR